MDSFPLVSIVVVNLNGRHLLGECLDSLAAQDYPPDRMEITNETHRHCPMLRNTIENQERVILTPGSQEQLTQRDPTNEVLQMTTRVRSSWGQRIGKAWKDAGQGDFHGLASEIRQFWPWQRRNSKSSL